MQGISCFDLKKGHSVSQKSFHNSKSLKKGQKTASEFCRRSFLGIKKAFSKIWARVALRLCMLYRILKKNFRKNIVEGKITRMENGKTWFWEKHKNIFSTNVFDISEFLTKIQFFLGGLPEILKVSGKIEVLGENLY